MAQDYYEILGVSRDADIKAIKKAYKSLAMKYHPDRNPGNAESEAKFKEINEAYSVLSDSEKRSQYDQFGHAAFENGGFGGQGGGFEDMFGGGGFGGFSDIFSDLFGGGRRQKRGPTPGEDLQYQVSITLEEAATGVSKEIKIQTKVTCKSCDGSGAEAGSKVETCPTCHGNGTVRTQNGPFISERECPTCRGTGKKIDKKCKACKGNGTVLKEKELSIKIPAGVDSGNQLRLRGEGNAGEVGAPNGDLYILIHVQDHPIFNRDGYNIYCDLPVSFATAALGAKIDAPTLTGKIEVTIPAETQTGRILRVAGKGIAHHKTQVGDLLLRIVVTTPVKLNEEQKDLLRKLDESLQKNNSSGLFDKMMNWFNKKAK